MKQFINDWSGDRENFDLNTHENKEYPINTWIRAGNHHRLYLASAYVYDEFVMFFYIYPRSPQQDAPTKITGCEIEQTYRDLVVQSRVHDAHVPFQYEVNHLQCKRGTGGECLPMPPQWESVAEEEQDEFYKMHIDEHDYLYSLMKDRLPEELRGVPLAFRKDCYSFSEPVTEITQLAIYPSTPELKWHFIDKTFTVPYGECDIKIPYTAEGAQSYIILRELKILDLLEYFDEHIDEFKAVYENSKDENNQTVIDFDELRQFWNKRLLAIYYLKPEENRSFEFYSSDYLNTKVPNSTSDTFNAFYITPDEDDKMDGELYKGMAPLGEVQGVTGSDYEITLMWASDSTKCERVPLFYGSSLTAKEI